jgi:hypothetical protein
LGQDDRSVKSRAFGLSPYAGQAPTAEGKKTSSVSRDESMQGIDMPDPVTETGTFVADTQFADFLAKHGGRYRDRTCGPYHVKVVLYR